MKEKNYYFFAQNWKIFFFHFRKRFSTKSSMILNSGGKCWWSLMASSSGNSPSIQALLGASPPSFSSFCGGWIFHSSHKSLSACSLQPSWIMAIHSYQSSFSSQKTGADLRRNCMSKLLARLLMSNCSWRVQFAPSSAVARKNRHL